MALGLIPFVLFGLLAQTCVSRRPSNDSSMEEDDRFSNDFPMCHHASANVSECVQRAAEHARVFLAHGVPSLGIQPLEPLRLPSVRLRQHAAPKAGFKYDAWLSDVILMGLTDYSFNKLDVFADELRVTGNVSLPHLYMTAEYAILGHFQMLPVEALGNLVANFTMCTAAIQGQGARVQGRMVIRDSNVHLACRGPVATDLHDTYTGRNDMAKITDHIVAMHSAEIVAEIKPAVETALSMVFEDIANKFLKHVPNDTEFPK